MMKNLFYTGLKAHSSSRLEFLTISLRKGSGIDLEACFERLNARIVGKRRKGIIQYAGVLVGEPPQHAHIIWKKPYVRWTELNEIWVDITGDKDSHIVCKTIRGDKSKVAPMRYMVTYIINQTTHHEDHPPVFLIRSPKWAIPDKRQDKKQKKLRVQNER